MISTVNLLSVHERTFRSKSHVKALHTPGVERPSLYKHWSEARHQSAYAAVKDGRFSVRSAAEEYNVPKSTLSDRVTGRVKFGAHCGPVRYLSDTGEEELVNFLCGSARMGYARTKRDIMVIVEEVVASKGKEVHIFNG